MTRQEILASFKVSPFGVIQDPGKFEGERLYMPVIYDRYMDGGSEDYMLDDDVIYSFVTVDDDMKKEFPELEGRDEDQVAFYEREDGFIVEVEPFDPEEEA